MPCKERSGFLFSHPCDQPPVKLCMRCQRSICLRHERQMDGKSMCVSCVKQLEHASDPGRARDVRRDDPYWYSGYHYRDYYGSDWDRRDRDVFERAPVTGAAAESLADEGDVDAS